MLGLIEIAPARCGPVPERQAKFGSHRGLGSLLLTNRGSWKLFTWLKNSAEVLRIDHLQECAAWIDPETMIFAMSFFPEPSTTP